MAYLPNAVPGPEPTIDDRPFWEGCEAGVLRFQRCSACRRFRHPPGPTCPACKSFACEWIEARDEAELFSFTIVHHAALSAVAPALPYNIAIVRFPSFNDIRLVSNVVDAAPAELRIGMRLTLLFERSGNGAALPRFRIRREQ